MGQRHQAYIIARIIPYGSTKAVYRCIGAWHDQWCYGRLPVRAARRFLTLIRQSDNAEIIREELKSISGKYGEHTNLDPMVPRVPCPYSTFLLASAFCFGIDDSDDGFGAVHATPSDYAFRDAIPPASIYPYEWNNNDGITVVDITDPENPSYCFVAIDSLEAIGHHPGLAHVPSTAETYCRAYYPQSDDPEENGSIDEIEEDVRRVIDSMANEKVMSRAAMEEAWPKEFKKQGNEIAVPIEQDVASTSLPSLVDLTLEGGVKQAINSGDVETLYPILLIPGKHSPIRGILQAFDPLPPAGVELFMKLNQNSLDSVDLSNIKFRSDDVVTVLSRYSGTKLTYLNLSHNSHVTADLLGAVLKAHPHIRRIVLFGTSITNEDMDSLLVSNPRLLYHIDQLIHPAYLTVASRASCPQPFSFFGWMAHQIPNIFSVPFFNPTAVVHCLDDYLYILVQELDTTSQGHLIGSNPASMTIFTDPSFGRFRKNWSERSVGFIPTTKSATKPMIEYIPVFSNPQKGWIFVMTKEETPADSSKYSFVHRVPSEGVPTLSIHDLDSFLVLLKEEYGGEPDTGVVETLRQTWDEAKISLNMTLMTSDELDRMISE